MIEPMRPEHAGAVLRIYQAGLDGGHASFETRAPRWATFDVQHRPDLRFVAVAERAVVGWVACRAASSRPVYAGVVEHSVFVDRARMGRGIGFALLTALLDACTPAGVWTVQAAIFPENTASLALHARLGFRTVGRRERIGRHHGVWRDTVLLEWRNPAL
jgi:phosphinothricin acetyltransferase